METKNEASPRHPARHTTPQEYRRMRRNYFILAFVAWAFGFAGAVPQRFSALAETLSNAPPLAVLLGAVIGLVIGFVTAPVLWGVLVVSCLLYPELFGRPTDLTLVGGGLAWIALIVAGRAWARVKGRHPDWGYLMAFPAIGALVLWRLRDRHEPTA